MTTNEMAHGVATINGAQLHYTQGGAQHDETIVMVHAGICDRRMWTAQMMHFAQRYHVVSYDMRGFGQSPMVGGAFALHDDLYGLLNHLGLEQAWLLGCSLGSKTAIDMTLLHPEHVRGLLLVAPAVSGYAYGDDFHPLLAEIDAADEVGDLERISELEVQMWVDGAGRTPNDVEPAVRQLVYEMNLIALKSDEALWDDERNLEPVAIDRLADIQKPTLVVIGALDVPASIERAELVAAKIPSAQKVVMPGTAHVPNMELPGRFNQIVDDFLTQV